MLNGIRREWANWTATPEATRRPCGCTCYQDHRIAWLWRQRRAIRLADNWYCSAQCLQKALECKFDRMFERSDPGWAPRHRIPLGLLMLARGYVSETQLGTALAAQRGATQGKIGHWLRQLGFVTEAQLVTALAIQWACPTLSFAADSEQCDLLPQAMQLSLQAVPVRFFPSRRLLYLAVSNQVDHTALHGIEVMLDCTASPCVVSDATMERLLLRSPSRPDPGVQAFDRVTDAAEMARIAASYVTRVSADEVRAVRCGPYIWLRLISRDSHTDLLFASRAPARDIAADSSRYSREQGPRRLVG